MKPVESFKLSGLRHLEECLSIRRVRIIGIAGRIAAAEEPSEVTIDHVRQAIKELDEK